MKKLFIMTIMLLLSSVVQAVVFVASPNENCMWPWTRPEITIGSTWEAMRCTSKNPYNKSCTIEIYHIVDIKDGYAQYNLTYTHSDGKKRTVSSSGNVKYLNCSYDSFKQI